MGLWDGAKVGFAVGFIVGLNDGAAVGMMVGAGVGSGKMMRNPTVEMAHPNRRTKANQLCMILIKVQYRT